ncbi:MAG: ATP synthase F1 subunit gamma [Lachnospiraceae bacterium]|nr:ATP synthase F1 subunit gamma [Lachnospiraceae bacterium]
MPNAAEIRTRINSITETRKVTDAMYMISSVKMRKARRELENTRPYFDALRLEIGELLHYIPENNDRYFRNLDPDGIRGRALIVITSDKGLSGSYNQLCIKAAEKRIGEYSDSIPFVIGEYGRQFFTSKKISMAQDFNYAAAFPTIQEARKICAQLLELYDSDKVDEVDIIYTHYKAGKSGEVRLQTLLPLDRTAFYDGNDFELAAGKEYLPSPSAVLDGIVASYLTGFIYSALVDSYCSEQEARMSAMSSAGHNADEMLKNLRIQYNAVRQAAITREITEIAAGAKALKKKRRKLNRMGE